MKFLICIVLLSVVFVSSASDIKLHYQTPENEKNDTVFHPMCNKIISITPLIVYPAHRTFMPKIIFSKNNNFLTVSTDRHEPFTITVFNTKGQAFITQVISDHNSIIKLNTPSAKGLYLYSIRFHNRTFCGRFILGE